MIVLSADGRVLWQGGGEEGNTYISIALFTASLRERRSRVVTGTYFQKDEGDPDNFDPRPLPMAADGNTILFYARCDASELCTGSRRPAAIYRLSERGSRRLTKVTDPAALALSGSRFVAVTNSLRCCNSKPAWSHDGKRLAWIYRGALWVVGVDGSGDRQLAAEVSPPYLSPTAVSRPSWSPDDSRLVFARTDARGREHAVYQVDASGGAARRLAAGAAPTWSPDGTRIAFVRGTGVFATRPDGSTATRVTTSPPVTSASLSWSPDSTRIAVSQGGDIYIARADGAGETRLTTSRTPDAQPVWSPDGTRIAYADGSGIAVINADGTGARRLTRGSDTSPAWSPDAKKIAFVRPESGQGELWLMNADGSGQRRLDRSDTYADAPQWSPDGGTIVIGDWLDQDSGNLPYRPGVRLVSPASGRATRVAPVLHSQVRLHDASEGRLVKRFTIVGHAQAAALGPGYIALLVDHDPGTRVELYDTTGRLRTATSVRPSVSSVSASGQTIVFAIGHAIRRLDARSGSVTTLAIARRTPVGLSIEGLRVVWAENHRGRARIRAVRAP